MSKFNDFVLAINDAKHTLDLADSFASKMARLLIGRLRRVDSTWILRQLKKELTEFNALTGEWKN